MSRRQRRRFTRAYDLLKPKPVFRTNPRKSRIARGFFGKTQKHYGEIQKQFGTDQFQRGLYQRFTHNPIGTMISIILIFLTIFYLGSGLGPITNASIAGDFNTLYNNTAPWLGPLIVFGIFIPSLALAVALPRAAVQQGIEEAGILEQRGRVFAAEKQAEIGRRFEAEKAKTFQQFRERFHRKKVEESPG